MMDYLEIRGKPLKTHNEFAVFFWVGFWIFYQRFLKKLSSVNKISGNPNETRGEFLDSPPSTDQRMPMKPSLSAH